MCLIASLQGLVPGPGIARLSGVVASSSETRGDFPSSSHKLPSCLVRSPDHPAPLETQSVSTQQASASHFVPL